MKTPHAMEPGFVLVSTLIIPTTPIWAAVTYASRNSSNELMPASRREPVVDPVTHISMECSMTSHANGIANPGGGRPVKVTNRRGPVQ